MKKLWTCSFALIFMLTGCSAINSAMDADKELIHKTTFEDKKIQAFYDLNQNSTNNLEFKVDGNTYGIKYEQGGFLTSDGKSYIYFDDKSEYDIYESGKLVEPIETFVWKDTYTASIYKLDANKELDAFYQGTTDFEGISKTFIIKPVNENKAIYEEIDFEAIQLLRLIGGGEQIFPERGGLAVESCELPPHQIALQSARIYFNKDKVQFYPRTTELMLSVSDPYKGIVKFTTWQLYEDFTDKMYYYQLTDEQIAEFDRITRYDEVVPSTIVE